MEQEADSSSQQHMKATTTGLRGVLDDKQGSPPHKRHKSLIDDQKEFPIYSKLPKPIREKTLNECAQWKESLFSQIDSIYTRFNDHKESIDHVELQGILRKLERFAELKFPMTLDEKAEVIRKLYTFVEQHERVDYFDQMLVFFGIMALLKKKETLDLVVDWRPLYRLIDSTYFTKYRKVVYTPKLHGSVLISLVRKLRRYFSAHATKEIFEEFRPIFCLHDHLLFKAQGFICLFLPTNHRETFWIPEVVNVWKWIGLYPTWDSQFLHLFARMAKQCVGQIDWDPYMEFIFQKMTIAFELPIGNSSQLYDEYPYDECSIFTSYDYAKNISTRNAAKLIVWSFKKDENGGRSFKFLKRLMKSIESFYHPSNEGEWTEPLAEFLLAIARQLAIRKQVEHDQPEDASYDGEPLGGKRKYVPKDCVLSDEFCKQIVELLYPLAMKAMYSKSHHMQTCANHTLKHLVYIQPDVVFPPLLQQCFHALQTLTETHQTVAALEVLSLVAFPLVRHSVFAEGADYLADIMNLTLPGIDNNDYKKTWTTFKFYTALLVCLPLFTEDSTSGSAPRAVAFIEDWSFRFLDRIFSLLQNEGSAGYSHNNVTNDYSSGIFRGVCDLFFSQLSPDLHEKCLRKVYQFVSTEFLVNAKENVGNLCETVSFPNPKNALKLFVPLCHDRLVDTKTGKLQQLTDNEKMWYVHILAQVVHRAGSELLPYKKQIWKVVELLIDSEEKKINQSVRKLIQNYVNALSMYYTREMRSQNPTVWDHLPQKEHWQYWSHFPKFEDLEVTWHVPSRTEIVQAVEFVNRFLAPLHNKLRDYVTSVKNDQSVTLSRNLVKAHFNVIDSFMRCATNFMPELRGKEEDADSQIYPNSRTIFCGKIDYEPEEGEPKLKLCLEDIVSLCCDAANVLYRKQKDVPALIPAITKSFFPIACIRCGTLRSTYKQRKSSHKVAKQHNFKVFNKEDEQYPRYLLVARVNLELSFRNVLYNEMLPYTEHHEMMLETLVQLSLSSYQQVRKKVHAYFMSIIHRFSANITRKFLPLVIDTLTNPNSTDDQVTGALALLSKGNSLNVVTTDWSLLRRILVALCSTQHVQKETTQAKIGEVFDMYFNAMYQLGIQKQEDMELYNGLIQELIKILESNTSMHWKYQTMASSFLMLLVRSDSTLFPLHGMQWMFQSLASDIPRVRIIAAEAVNLILAQYRPVQPRKEVRVEEKHLLGKWGQLPVPTNEEEFSHTNYFEKNFCGWYVTPEVSLVYDYSKPFAGPTEEIEQKREKLKEQLRAIMTDEWLEKFFRHHTHRDDSFSETFAQMFKGMFQLFGMEFYERCKPFIVEISKHAGSGKLDESGHMAAASEFVGGLIRGMKHWRFAEQQRIFGELTELWDTVLDKCSQGCITEWSEGFEFATSDKDPRRLRPMIEYFFNRFQRSIGRATTNIQVRYIKFLYGIVGEISWRDTELMSRVLMELSNHLYHPYQQVREYISMLVSLIMKTIWYCPRDINTGLPAIKIPGSIGVNEDEQDEMTDEDGDPTETQFPAVRDFLRIVMQQVEKDENGVLKMFQGVDIGQPHPAHVTSSVVEPNSPASSSSAIADASSPAPGAHAAFAQDRKELLRRLVKSYSDTTLTFISSLFCSCAPHPLMRHTVEVLKVTAVLQDQNEETLNSDVFDTLQTVANFPFSPADAKNVLTFIIKNFTQFSNWRLRKSLLLFLNVFIFRHQFALQSERKVLFGLLVQGLKDTQVEVRQVASSTLAGYLRLSEDEEVNVLAAEFRKLAKDPFENRQKRRRRRGSIPSVVVSPQNRKTHEDVVARHAGVLGLRSIVTAYPHDIPDFLPSLLVLLAKYSHDRVQQIRESVRKTFSDFWKCHRDTWRIEKKHFDEDQLAVLTDILISPSYYA